MRIATPSLQRTFTTYSLPVSTGAPVCLISAQPNLTQPQIYYKRLRRSRDFQTPNTTAAKKMIPPPFDQLVLQIVFVSQGCVEHRHRPVRRPCDTILPPHQNSASRL